MRRIVSMALCVWLLLGLCPAARAEGTVSIGSREDMLLIAADPTGSYELTADIDMGEAPWTPLPFCGKLNGNGHTLYNLTVIAPGPDTATTFDGNRKEYETVFGGLFSVVKDAEIRDVGLVNAVIDVTTDRHCFLGALAGYAERSAFTGCSVQTRSHLTLSSVNAGVGGLAGFSLESEFRDCTVDAELVFTDVNTDVLCEEFIGGAFSCGSGRVEGCAVRTRGFSEVYGYAHNGGIIGMYKEPKGSRFKSAVINTTADTEFSFFEITPSRRAYCSPTIGEDTYREVARQKMNTLHYAKYESKTPVRLSPEKCEAPQYASVTVPGDCHTWGYTVHTCEGCGYSYRDSYTPPVHQYAAAEAVAPTCTEAGEQTYGCTLCGESCQSPIPALGHDYEQTLTLPTCTEDGERVFTCARCGDRYIEPIPATGHEPGEWATEKAPKVNEAGEKVRLCAVCGEVLERREVPALPYVYAERIALSADSLSLTPGETAKLTARLTPEDATDPTLTFFSSDEAVARVLPDGTVQAEKPGTAAIACTSADGRASANCTVTVTYTPWQWVRHYVLFGWLWE